VIQDIIKIQPIQIYVYNVELELLPVLEHQLILLVNQDGFQLH